MNSKERMLVALSGGIPDQVPLGFFYNCDYMSERAGITPQAYIFGTNEDRFQAMSSTYERHRGVDWIHADPGIRHDWENEHELVWDEGNPYVVSRRNGERDAIQLDLRLASSGERSHGPDLDFGYSYIKLGRPAEEIHSNKDLEGAHVRTAQELVDEGFLDPPRQLVERYGQHTFITLPMSNIFFNSVYFFGLEEGLIATITNAALFDALLELNTEQELEVIKAAAKVGLDGVWLAEMLISADVISPRLFEQKLAPLHRKLVQEAHRLGLKVLTYLTGDCLQLLQIAREVGYDGVVVESQDQHGNKIDVAEIRQRLGPEICVFGNLDPVDHLIRGDETTIFEEVRRQIYAAGKEGAFVMHANIVSLPIQPKRIDLVIQATREIGQYPLNRT